LSHLYGRDGRDTNKTDTKSLIFDFEFFQKLVEPETLKSFNQCLLEFVEEINSNQTKGGKKI